MKIRSLCLLAALCLPALHAENLITNGDMKQNSGWRIWGSAPMQKEIRSKILTYPNAGPKQERVLQINDICDDHNPYAINFAFPPAIQKGQKYLLKFRANAKPGQVFHVVMMGEIAKTATTPGKYLGGPSKTFTGTGKWQEYSHVFRDIPAGTNKLGVAFSPFPMSSDNTKKGVLLLTDVSMQQDTSPDPVDPRTLFGKLKITSRDLCINTALVTDGKPAVTIVGDRKLARILADAIKTKTGVTISVTDKDPGKGNVITIGNRDRNDFVCSLYNWHYTLLDAKYPGKGGYEVRSLHNPFGNKRNFILCGGSDAAGDKAAVEKTLRWDILPMCSWTRLIWFRRMPKMSNSGNNPSVTATRGTSAGTAFPKIWRFSMSPAKKIMRTNFSVWHSPKTRRRKRNFLNVTEKPTRTTFPILSKVSITIAGS